MILARLQDKLKIGTKEGATKLGDELLTSVTFIAPALAPELAIKA